MSPDALFQLGMGSIAVDAPQTEGTSALNAPRLRMQARRPAERPARR